MKVNDGNYSIKIKTHPVITTLIVIEVLFILTTLFLVAGDIGLINSN